VNAQVVEIKGRDVVLAFHPDGGEPLPGDALLLTERRGSPGGGLIVQGISYDSMTYPGDREALLGEILEATIADREEVVRGEPAMLDLKEIKLLRCKIRKASTASGWREWQGTIPSRNVTVERVTDPELLEEVIAPADFPIRFAAYGSTPVVFDAKNLDKVNAIVGVKNTGKSHTGKHIVHALSKHSAPIWVFDINREFIDLPGADVIRIGENYKLRLDEVGFPFLMAVIEDLNPFTPVSQGAFESEGPRLMEQEVARTGMATIGFLLERAEQGAFHNNEMVNGAIEQRLRMVGRQHLFAESKDSETLASRFNRTTDAGGFLVFDIAELGLGKVKALTRGLNRQVERICEHERKTGRGRYPFVFYEEAHFYASPVEILNLITRGRHLGLTVFFVTNTPGDLPEVVFRQLDNLIVTGLSHASDLRVIAKCSLSDDDTLQALAGSLGATEALVVGKLTSGFPLVVTVDPLPADFPATGRTRSYWDFANPKAKSA
jgi:hypothetical protein